MSERTLELELGGADFFDLGWSSLFNSLPVIRDRVLEPGPPHEYVGAALRALGDGVIRFGAGDFVSHITFDPAGFVVNYPGIGARP